MQTQVHLAHAGYTIDWHGELTAQKVSTQQPRRLGNLGSLQPILGVLAPISQMYLLL